MAPDVAEPNARKKIRGSREICGKPGDSSTQSKESHSPATSGETKKEAPKNLEVIFNNPILLSSFLAHFKREDYTFLANLAASIPGISHTWPRWNPLTQPWPQGQLPFDVCILTVECQNERSPIRRLILDANAKGEPHPEYFKCIWKFTEDPLKRKKCDLSSKDLGVRLKAGHNPGQLQEKKPVEFFECAGHKILPADTPF